MSYTPSASFIDITIAGMRNGERGLAFRYETVAHEEEKLINRYGRVKVYDNVDMTRLQSEVEIEKIPEGWLIDGVLYTACEAECHGRLFV